MTTRVLGFLLLVSLLSPALLACPTAQAQGVERLLVLRTVPGQEPPGFSAAADVVEQRARRARTALLRDLAARLITERHSAEATAVSEDEFDELARASDQALEHVAFGRRGEAREAVARILERAQGALEALNREARSARRVLNSCLYLVRALADSGDRAAALVQSVECARMVPDMRPSAAEHPPNVRELFVQAVDQIQHGPHGTLRVGSEPAGCDVYLNGRRLGSTPFERERLPTGEYRVQVECGDTGRPGRVHKVILSAEPRELHIDSRFDTVLRTSTGEVRLEYWDDETENEDRLTDALHVARIVSASEIVLMTPEADDVVRLDLVQVPEQTVTASVRVALDPSGMPRALAHAAMDALLEGNSVDLRQTPPAPMETWTAPVRRQAVAVTGATEGPDGEAGPAATAPVAFERGPSAPVAGWVLAGLGAATIGVAWGLQIEWFRLQDRVQVAEPSDPDFEDRVDKRDGLRLPTSLVAAGGATLTTAALPFLVGDGGAAWWHFALGAVGVGGAVTGAVVWSQEGSCIGALCAERRRRVPLGPVIVATSLPLLALPLVAMLMESGDDEAAPVSLSPVIDAGGASLTLSGAF